MISDHNRLILLGVFCAIFILSIPPLMAQALYFDPDPYIPQDYTFTVPLIIETNGHEVKGVESSITFDPALVKLDSIKPGPWYTDSGQDVFFWDYTTPFTYAIHFASAMLDGARSSDGIIAYCHFSFVGFGTCPLVFDDVDVRDMNNQALPFGSADGMIMLGNAVETDKVAFSSLKAIYR